MSDKRGEKIIHVDKLVIHAREVEIIRDRPEPVVNDLTERRMPWDFMMGGPRRVEPVRKDESSSSSSRAERD